MSYFVTLFLDTLKHFIFGSFCISLIQFRLNKSKHYVSQNLCWNRGIKLLVGKNLLENGQTYQFVNQIIFINF